MSSDKNSKSTRLRKYGIVYLLHMSGKYNRVYTSRHTSKHTSKHASSTAPKKSREIKSLSKNRDLNSYQKFVKEESKKSLYKNLKAKERMDIIAKKWKEKKQTVV